MHGSYAIIEAERSRLLWPNEFHASSTSNGLFTSFAPTSPCARQLKGPPPPPPTCFDFYLSAFSL